MRIPSLIDRADRYRNMSDKERARVLSSVCRVAMDQILARADPAAVLAHRDPLPASTEAALKRLRKEHAAAQARR